MPTRPMGPSGLFCLLVAAGGLSCLPAAAGKDESSSLQSWTLATPWSEVWMRVWVGEVAVHSGDKPVPGLWPFEERPNGGTEMHTTGVFGRDQADQYLKALKQGQGMVLNEVPPRVVRGSLPAMEVPVEALAKGAKVRFTPAVEEDGDTLDLKMSCPSVGLHGTGKQVEMQLSIRDGQTMAFDQITARRAGVDYHVVLLVSAEALEHITKTPGQETGPFAKPFRKPLTDRMSRPVLSQLVLHNASLTQALGELESQYLNAKFKDRSLWNDTINFAIRPRVTEYSTAQISLDLHDVTLLEALRDVTNLAGVTWRPAGDFVIVEGIDTEEGMELMTGTYKVPADLSERLEHAAGQRSVRDVLAAQGVSFPEGAEAVLDKKTGHLTVKATPQNLRLVESLVEKAWREPVGCDLHQARWLIIPKINFQDVTLEEALDSIAKKSRAADPEKRGANATVAPGCQTHRHLTLSVENVSALEAYFYAAKLTGHQVTLKKGSIVISPEKKS